MSAVRGCPRRCYGACGGGCRWCPGAGLGRLAGVEEEEAEQVEEEEGFRKGAPPGYSAERSRRTCVQLREVL